ncbi:MAG: GNAT family N-acetyltransferase [Hyphomonadaceae bacterium]
MRLAVRARYGAATSPWKTDAVLYDVRANWRKVGRLSFRPSTDIRNLLYAGQVGYRIAEQYRGRGYAAEAVRLLLPIARGRGLDELWVTCNPDNRASIRTLEKIGAVYVETVDLPPGEYYYERGEVQKRRYRIDI